MQDVQALLERAEPHPTSPTTHKANQAQGRLKTPEVFLFHAFVMSWNSWASYLSKSGHLNGVTFLRGRHPNPFPTNAKKWEKHIKKQRVGCWSSGTFYLYIAYFSHLQVYFTLMSTDSMPQTKSTTCVKTLEFCLLSHLPPYDCPPSIIPKSRMGFNGWMTTNIPTRPTQNFIVNHFTPPNSLVKINNQHLTGPCDCFGRSNSGLLCAWVYTHLRDKSTPSFGNVPSSFSANSLGSAVGSCATSSTNFTKSCPAPHMNDEIACQCLVLLHIYVDWVSALEASPIGYRCLVNGFDTWNQMNPNLFMWNCCRVVIW